jgi:hypothetical protein
VRGAGCRPQPDDVVYSKHLTLAQIDAGHQVLTDLCARFPGVLLTVRIVPRLLKLLDAAVARRAPDRVGRRPNPPPA